ncbi:hypothetical protein BGZ68_003042 [Mortierella alpina]|nr:hypothetical protein BGZ68_003042 [Mortierella alpina]
MATCLPSYHKLYALIAAVATPRLLQDNVILTGALLLGKDTSNPHASPLDVYRNPNNHVTAVASITVNAAHRASLKPSSKAADEDTYSGFKIRVSSFPGYKFNFAKFKDFLFHEKFDLKEHASTIYRDFARSSRSEADEVASALLGVVGDHLKEAKQEQGSVMNWVFSEVVVRQLTFTIQLEIVELSVRRQKDNYVATLEVRSFHVITPVLTARAVEFR